MEKKGYKNIEIWAFKNECLFSGWAVTHWNKSSTLQALFDLFTVNFGGAKYW